MLTGAQVMVKCLEAEGIKAVFGYPGVAICPFYDSLYDSGIRNILVRQEQNGGHMASGYARVTRKPAVCVATSGPGATNLITALATAYADSIPLIAITGQVSSELLGRKQILPVLQNPLLSTVILSGMPERSHVFSRKLSTLHLRDAAVRCLLMCRWMFSRNRLIMCR